MTEDLGNKTPVDEEPLAIITPIPLARRKRDAWIWLAVTAGICAAFWILQARNDSFTDYWWYVWPNTADWRARRLQCPL